MFAVKLCIYTTLVTASSDPDVQEADDVALLHLGGSVKRVRSEAVSEDEPASFEDSAEETALLQEKVKELQRTANEDAESQTASVMASALQEMQEQVAVSIGDDGVLMEEVEGEPACPPAFSLHHTYVHLDKSYHFVCKPCKRGCVHCYGSGQDECLDFDKPPPATASSHAKTLVDKVHKDFTAMLEKLKNVPAVVSEDGEISMPGHKFKDLTIDDAKLVESYDEKVIEDDDETLAACADDDGTCEVKQSIEVEGEFDCKAPASGATSVITDIGDVNDDTKSLDDLSEAELKCLPVMNKANKEDGLLGDGDAWDGDKDGELPASEQPEDDDAADDEELNNMELDAEFANLIESASEDGNVSLLATNDSTAWCGISEHANNRIKGRAMQTYGDRSKATLKRHLKAWLDNAAEGPCLDAVTEMVEISSDFYKCYQENKNQAEAVLCKPGADIREVQDLLHNVKNVAKTVRIVSGVLKSAPYVGTVAKVVHTASNLVERNIGKGLPIIDNQFRRHPGGPLRKWTAKQECCHPWPDAKCRATALRDCGGCLGGAGCPWEQGCRTVKNLDSKVQKWKEKWDELTRRIAEAAKCVSAGANTLNNVCLTNVGVNTCQDVKNIVTNLRNTFQRELLDHVCPLSVKIPRPPAVNLGIVKLMGSIFGSLSGFFNKLNGILNFRHCLSYLASSWGSVRSCHNVCVSVPGHGRRRRWSGFRWNRACHQVCVWVPKVRFYWKQVCFSAMSILKGLGSFLNTLFYPIIKVIELALSPVINLINAKISGLISDIAGLIPDPPQLNLKLLNFKLPIPELNFRCPLHSEGSFLRNLKR
jgi:predicted translin family RNA/ssDNA-binding protein